MSYPVSNGWQLTFPDGLSESQVVRIAEFAVREGIAASAEGVNTRRDVLYSYDRATVELYRHVLQKVIDGRELTSANRMTLTDHVDELERWLQPSDGSPSVSGDPDKAPDTD
ncbi:hypothetical protein [Nocardia jinanensis]|uniref:hypothetical protein n=1 Tax=Nocardia jinanensis TaxID=382504 RepID=UPI000A917F5A|nr:hypothetical protein [Nocardia jinanensis]